MASPDMKAEVERAQSRSTELELMIHNRQPIPLQGNRKYLIAGYWALTVDLHRSVLVLLKPDVNLCGGGFALARPMMKKILEIGINKCARKSGFHRANFIRKLVRGIPVKRNSYNEFVRCLYQYDGKL